MVSFPKMKRHLLFFTILAGVFLTAIILFVVHSRGKPSALDQLKAIEAARAIPDEENAATHYTRIVEMDPQLQLPEVPGQNIEYITRASPWRSHEYPEVAEWIQSHNPVIEALLAIRQIEKCVHPLVDSSHPYSVGFDPHLTPMRQWAFLLARAACNDLTEGKKHDALSKVQTLYQMSVHLRQQPTFNSFLLSTALETVALHVQDTFTMLGQATNEDLNQLADMTGAFGNEFDSLFQETKEVEDLLDRRLLDAISAWGRLRNWWDRLHIQPNLEASARRFYIRMLANRRASRILVELRRSKNRTGNWPKSLDQIESHVPDIVLIDPHCDSSFVYRRTDAEFILYSIGFNGRDENGRFEIGRAVFGDAGDWPIWPRRHSPAYEKWQKANEP